MILYTERLILRHWEESDADDLYEYAKDPAVGPAAGWAVHTSPEYSREIIRDVFSGDEVYAICLKETGRPVGSIGLMMNGESNLRLSENEAEVGYWIGVPFWGMGYASEALREIVRHGFEELKMESLWCGYFDGNDRSRRVQEKCGFRYRFTLKDIYWEMIDAVRTEHISCLLRSEWKSPDIR
ncbi:MAG: GNAT family N-acetyltransferase [Huintestinicola sp.]